MKNIIYRKNLPCFIAALGVFALSQAGVNASVLIPIAQAGGGDFETGFQTTFSILQKVAFLICFILIVSAGFAFRGGNPDQGKAALIGGAIIGLAATLAGAFFSAGGMDAGIIQSTGGGGQ